MKCVSSPAQLGHIPVAAFDVLDPETAWADTIREFIDGPGFGVITGFPADPQVLLERGSLLGTPSRKPTYNVGPTHKAGVFEWIGDVRFYSDLHPADRRPTQDSSAIGPHTARSFAADAPRLFLMLLAEPCSGGSAGAQGESILVRLDDALGVLRDTLPADAAQDALRTLRETPVTVSGPDGELQVRVLEPSARGDRLRYWLTIEADVRAAGDAALLRAWQLLDWALRSDAASTICALDRGDLIVLDNDRVAHGRQPFPRWDADGIAVLPSRRQLFSLHVYPDGATG